MKFTTLIYRFRWLQLPTSLLAMLLQRTPVLRVLATDGPGFAIRSADILKSAFALAALGAYNSVTGATTFSATVVSPTTVTPTSVVKPSVGPFVVSSPASSAFSFAVNVTGAPGTAKSWKVTGTLPSGVTISGGTVSGTSIIYNGLKVTLAGTPTAGYTGNLTIAAYDSTGATGNTASVNCMLTITAPPAFTTQPLAQTVTEGGGATFTAAASGTPAPTYQWFKGASALSGKTTATLSLTNIQLADAGNYKVVATNSAAPSGVSSNIVALTVNPATVAPTFSLQPTPRTVIAGTSVTLSVAASGTPAPNLQWLKGTTALPNQTAATLTLSNVQPADAGDYKAVATNSAAPSGISSSIATIAVVPVPSASIRLAAGARQIDVTSLSGYSYQLQSAPDLTGGSWTALGAAQGGTGGTLTFSDGPAGASFYRVIIAPSAP